MLVDEGSRNGSYLNGERMRAARPLRDGDVLRFGDTVVLFRAPGRTPSGGPRSPSPSRSPPSERAPLAHRNRSRWTPNRVRVDNGGVSANPPAGEQAMSELKARVEAERSGQPFLLYTDGDGRQQLFLFEPGMTEASIGRERSTDIVLGWDAEVSRLHARLERSEEDWTIVDDGLSSNGTFVNDQRISGRVRLTDGDTLRLGATTIIFRAPVPGGRPRRRPPARARSRWTCPPPSAACSPRCAAPTAREPAPAADEQIAEQLFLPVNSVRTHLMVLSAKLGVDQAPPDQQRVQLVERAVHGGLITERDL